MLTEAPRRLVMDLAATSRNWALTSEGEARVRGEAPTGWAVDVVRAPTSSDGDGPQGGSDEAQRLIADAEIYFGFGITPDLFAAARRLRWVHSAAAGVGNVLQSGIAETEVALTNSAGIHGPPIAEFVVAGILHFLRGLDVAMAQQRRGVWDKAFFVSEDSPLREVSDCRILIVGAGGLGSEAARRLTALGAHCVGLRRRPELEPPAGFAEVYGIEVLERELPSADVVVLAAPLTPGTSELMTRARLALLPPGAIVVNVSRGALLDEEAVADMLEGGGCAARCSTCSGRSHWRRRAASGRFRGRWWCRTSLPCRRAASGHDSWTSFSTTGAGTWQGSRCATSSTSRQGTDSWSESSRRPSTGVHRTCTSRPATYSGPASTASWCPSRSRR